LAGNPRRFAQELPFGAEGHIAKAAFAVDAFRAAFVNFRLLLECAAQAEINLQAGEQPVSQAHGPIPVMAPGVFFVPAAGLDLELPQLLRIGVVDD